ncbi:MAG: translation initiation factor IF-2 [Candidatus Helarchaeota archaeon]
MSKAKDVRQPIVAVLGHIDSGKTSILDNIRGTGVQNREAGGITQHIGASFLPSSTIETICGPLLKKLGIPKLTIPGLLVIDTPGHAAFMNLRTRGGAVADIAILVVDITEGFQEQTRESVRILRTRKTPFLIAANKIDRIRGWKKKENQTILESIKIQDQYVQDELDKLLYEIVGDLAFEKLNGDRFDRVKDFTTNVAIIPTSAKTGEGIPEVLMVLAGLSQQYLKNRLTVSKGAAKGTILEVKEETGLGLTLDTIIYEGVLRKDDTIILGSIGEPIITRIRALLLPKPLDEIRDPREKFEKVNKIAAASGIKIVAPNLEGVLSGAPLRATSKPDEIEKYKQEIMEELSEFRIETETNGVILKVDTLGSLEALVEYLKEQEIPIRMADVGPVSKRDVKEAAIVKDRDPSYGCILSFNNKILPDAREEIQAADIHVIENKIIYRLIEDFQGWHYDVKEKIKRLELKDVKKPVKVHYLPGFTFRNKDPAIVGVRIEAGTLVPNRVLISSEEGYRIGKIKGIQDKGQNIPEAEQGSEVAISIIGGMVGRNLHENDIMYCDLSEHDYKILKKKFYDDLTTEEQETLEEIVKIKRKNKTYWGM